MNGNARFNHKAVSAPGAAEIHKDVQNYYGNVLKTFADLQTNACVTPATLVPKYIRETLKNVHEDVTSRYYGCGLVVPERLENCQILDLGCGSGRDCYMLSQLVGEKGHVTGIDMTKAQVEVAKTYLEYHMKKFGFQAPNVTFIHGCIEKLAEAGAQQESYDIAVSNCVINLVPDKEQVLREVYDTLKYGGELYFSDVYANLEVPEDIKSHKVLWGECLGGALYWKDLAIIAQKIGFCPPRLVTANLITIQNKELESVLGDCRFVSATFRLFKLPKTGQAKRCQAVYKGGITGHEKELIFDANFTFKHIPRLRTQLGWQGACLVCVKLAFNPHCMEAAAVAHPVCHPGTRKAEAGGLEVHVLIPPIENKTAATV
ncbi:arsenite methyltransferase isoform X3 [Microtus pennsylvanicus]|uniref:arsenite methyltransferase isoform X3 n=1 Tax=Microtus pennsylvanicus TaxID=10058 RepID=UPI003F6AE82F